MRPPKEIIFWVKRRWRSAGHGIHSPFAFAFITDVLHPGRRAPLRNLPLVERIERWFASDPVASRLERPEVLIFRGIDRKGETRKEWERVRAEMTRGMTFTDGRTAVVCLLNRLPLSHFKIIIKP